MSGSIRTKQDIERLFAKLGTSKFRSKFQLSSKDCAYFVEKGPATIRAHAVDFITSRLAPANPTNDGRQTPLRGHPVFIAQHATATCCRSCLQKWHQIPQGRQLHADEIEYICNVIMRWIELDAA